MIHVQCISLLPKKPAITVISSVNKYHTMPQIIPPPLISGYNTIITRVKLPIPLHMHGCMYVYNEINLLYQVQLLKMFLTDKVNSSHEYTHMCINLHAYAQHMHIHAAPKYIFDYVNMVKHIPSAV